MKNCFSSINSVSELVCVNKRIPKTKTSEIEIVACDRATILPQPNRLPMILECHVINGG